MKFLLLLFAFYVQAQTIWSEEDIAKIIRSKATQQENSYLSELCETQLREKRTPTACFADAKQDAELLQFLDSRCQAWIGKEKESVILEKWVEHPQISADCRNLIQQRLSELRYIQEEEAPLDFYQARKSRLARVLNKPMQWKQSSHHKR